MRFLTSLDFSKIEHCRAGLRCSARGLLYRTNISFFKFRFDRRLQRDVVRVDQWQNRGSFLFGPLQGIVNSAHLFRPKSWPDLSVGCLSSPSSALPGSAGRLVPGDESELPDLYHFAQMYRASPAKG